MLFSIRQTSWPTLSSAATNRRFRLTEGVVNEHIGHTGAWPTVRLTDTGIRTENLPAGSPTPSH